MMSLWSAKFGWILLVIAIVGDFLIAYILAFYYSGYNHMKQVMSVLGNPKSPVAFFYNMWLIIFGILICSASVNFYHTYCKVSQSYARIGLIILLIFGIGAGIIAGVFSVNEGREIETLASKIHGIGAGLGFMALTFLPLVIGLISFKNSDSVIGTASIIFFIMSIVFFVLFIMSEKEIFQDSIIGLSGLWQRLLLASMYMPLLLIAQKYI
ncbi:MAG: hypothetical protein K0S30_2349 [Clostridia bacterium]|jgi:hypothetical membrane protein|nr:hypothetical protein [Clostridia bacterium]